MFVSILLTVVAGFGAFHSADYNPQNGRIELTELLRVIQFYNAGGYRCEDSGGSQVDGDGYAVGLGGDCEPHDSDYNPQDWRINLTELLRLIQFFNTGGYHLCESGDGDGYCAGPPGGEPEGEGEGDGWVEEETDGDFFIGEFAIYYLTLPGPGTVRVQAYDGSFVEAVITTTDLEVVNRVTATIALDLMSDGRIRVTKDWVSGTEVGADWIRFGFKGEDETLFTLATRTVTVR